VPGIVTQLHRNADHGFSKPSEPTLHLVAGMGVEGDAHFGATVRHRSRVAADPTQPNLRQVHLIQAELLEELAAEGFRVGPGDLGENITAAGVDLLSLPVGSVLRIGEALLGVTGLRNPCRQIEHFEKGLLKRVTDSSGHGRHRAGVMAVVLHGGQVAVGDTVDCSPPPGPPIPLTRV
jgi:MOSC domain-containing protein YiiM